MFFLVTCMFFFIFFFFFSSRRRHTRWNCDWEFRRVLFRSGRRCRRRWCHSWCVLSVLGARPGVSVPVGAWPHHGHGAVGVLEHGVADRPQEQAAEAAAPARSEERRVGKERGAWGSAWR